MTLYDQELINLAKAMSGRYARHIGAVHGKTEAARALSSSQYGLSSRFGGAQVSGDALRYVSPKEVRGFAYPRQLPARSLQSFRNIPSSVKARHRGKYSRAFTDRYNQALGYDVKPRFGLRVRRALKLALKYGR